MKKNVMMRLASVLLVAVMLTTCVISGTFAKYVTNGTATDSARVAKWGVTVVADGNNTFGGIYKNVANGNTINTSYTFGTDTVKSEGGNVVAPGTKGTAAGLTINGQPEVDTEVTFTADVTLDKRNGAVFIFAFFKYARDCAKTENPPNPHKLAQIGKVKSVLPFTESVFKPLVHSNKPKVIDFEVFSLPVIFVSKKIKGLSMPSDNKTSVKR